MAAPVGAVCVPPWPIRVGDSRMAVPVSLVWWASLSGKGACREGQDGGASRRGRAFAVLIHLPSVSVNANC